MRTLAQEITLLNYKVNKLHKQRRRLIRRVKNTDNMRFLTKNLRELNRTEKELTKYIDKRNKKLTRFKKREREELVKRQVHTGIDTERMCSAPPRMIKHGSIGSATIVERPYGEGWHLNGGCQHGEACKERDLCAGSSADALSTHPSK